MFSLLPDLKGKRVLDLGCGFGEHCKKFVNCGARNVLGIDISEKMLEVAISENSDPKIRYINMPMENIGQLQERFDIAISSLAFHYVEDFEGVIKNVYKSVYKSSNSFVVIAKPPHNYDSCSFSRSQSKTSL